MYYFYTGGFSGGTELECWLKIGAIEIQRFKDSINSQFAAAYSLKMWLIKYVSHLFLNILNFFYVPAKNSGLQFIWIYCMSFLNDSVPEILAFSNS